MQPQVYHIREHIWPRDYNQGDGGEYGSGVSGTWQYMISILTVKDKKEKSQVK